MRLDQLRSAFGGSDGKGPLQGLRVLDAGTMTAGPLAATHLADFGAEDRLGLDEAEFKRLIEAGVI